MSNATQSTINAIVSRYNSSEGDAIRTAGATGIYFGRAPQEAVYPFVVLTVPAGVTDPTVGQGTAGGAIYDAIDVSVAVFTDKRSPNIPYNIIGAWHAAFNFAELSLASPYRLVVGRKIDDGIAIEEPSQKGWQVVALYVYNVGE